MQTFSSGPNSATELVSFSGQRSAQPHQCTILLGKKTGTEGRSNRRFVLISLYFSIDVVIYIVSILVYLVS